MSICVCVYTYVYVLRMYACIYILVCVFARGRGWPCVSVEYHWFGLIGVCFSYIRCGAGLMCWRRCGAACGRGWLTLGCVARKLIGYVNGCKRVV